MNDEETRQRAMAVAEARAWIGTPYHHRGRVKGAGVDCAMLPAEVYAGCGLISHVEVPAYPRDWHLNRKQALFEEIVSRYARPVGFPLPGDMVLYCFGHSLAHGAIVVAWPRIIHAVLGDRVIEDDGESPVLTLTGGAHAIRKRTRKFYRLFAWADDQ